MADFTHILFPEIPKDVILTSNYVPVVANVKYHKDSLFKIKKKYIKDTGYPYEKIKFIAYNGDIESNVSHINVNLLVAEGEPNSLDTVCYPRQTELIYMDEWIHPNDSSDRIIIENFREDRGLVIYENNPAYIGQVVMKKDLNKLRFKSRYGSVAIYNTITYRAANYAKKAENTNKVDFVLEGNTGIALVEYRGEVVNNRNRRMVNSIFFNAPLDSVIKVKVETNIMWPYGDDNEIFFTTDNFSKSYRDNFTEIYTLNTDSTGYLNLNILIDFALENEIGSMVGTVKLTLIEVNGGPVNAYEGFDKLEIDFSKPYSDYMPPPEIPFQDFSPGHIPLPEEENFTGYIPETNEPNTEE